MLHRNLTAMMSTFQVLLILMKRYDTDLEPFDTLLRNIAYHYVLLSIHQGRNHHVFAMTVSERVHYLNPLKELLC